MEAKKLSPRIPASKMHKLFLLRRILLQKAMQGGEMYFGQLPTLEYIVRHEGEAEQQFDALNEELCAAATNANTFANILMA